MKKPKNIKKKNVKQSKKVFGKKEDDNLSTSKTNHSTTQSKIEDKKSNFGNIRGSKYSNANKKLVFGSTEDDYSYDASLSTNRRYVIGGKSKNLITKYNEPREKHEKKHNNSIRKSTPSVLSNDGESKRSLPSKPKKTNLRNNTSNGNAIKSYSPKYPTNKKKSRGKMIIF